MMCTTDDDDIDFSSIKKNVQQVVHERRKRVIQNIFAQKERSPLPPGVVFSTFFFLFFFLFFLLQSSQTLFVCLFLFVFFFLA